MDLRYSLRLVAYFVILTVLLCCVGSTNNGHTSMELKTAEWKVGYCYWKDWGIGGRGVTGKEAVPVDLLYVQVGEF